MTECDFAPVHSTLSSLPKNSSLEGLNFTVKPAIDNLTIGEGSENDASVSGLNSVSVEGDLSFIGSGDGDDAETQSLMSTTSTIGSTCGVKAPFQEILDLALKYMERFPPKHLLKVSKRYFFEDQLQPMMSIVPSITLLHPQPKWGLISHTAADWVLKQRRCKEEGRSLNRRGRRERKKTFEKTEQEHKKNSNDDDIMLYLRKHCKDKAVIACGYGRGEEEFLARRRLRRIALTTAAMAIVIVIAVTFIQPKILGSEPIPQEMDGICTGKGSCSATERKLNVHDNEGKIEPLHEGGEISFVGLDTNRLRSSNLVSLSFSRTSTMPNDLRPRSSVKAALGSKRSSLAETFRMVKGKAIENDAGKLVFSTLREEGQVNVYESVTSFIPRLLKTAVRSIGKFVREIRSSFLEASEINDDSNNLLAFFE
mmetsp:Transcript_32418/g.49301  ORF Transcript_32418/g.49301 Transcript_32418/m.49301 type:complete len:425 (+) Transcript_32418:1-1275(+)